VRLTATLKSFIAEDNREKKLYINNVPKEHNVKSINRFTLKDTLRYKKTMDSAHMWPPEGL